MRKVLNLSGGKLKTSRTCGVVQLNKDYNCNQLIGAIVSATFDTNIIIRY